MKATIIRADEVNVGDRIAFVDSVLEVVSVEPLKYVPSVRVHFPEGSPVHGDSACFIKSSLVARVDPEPVSSEDTWWVTINGYREYELTDREIAISVATSMIGRRNDSVLIEHVRETVLSREELNTGKANAE